MFIFSLAAIVLPLLPLTALFIRNSLDQPGMPLLAALCVFAFLREILCVGLSSLPLNAAAINAIFNPVEIITLSLLFSSIIKNKCLKQYLNLILTSVLSVILTIYALEGVSAYAGRINAFLSLFIIALSLMAIYTIIINEQSFILHSPLFWIGGGSLGYFAIFLLSEILKRYEFPVTPDIETEQFILLKAITIVRYVFYATGVLLARANPVQIS